MWPDEGSLGWLWFAWPLVAVAVIVLIGTLARRAPRRNGSGEESADAIRSRRHVRGGLEEQEFPRRLRERRK